MKMMSVKEADIGWSWFLSFFLFHIITATLAALVTIRLFENSNGAILWIFWLFTMLSIIVFCMFISSFFTKSTRATLLGLLLFFVGYFLTLIVDFQEGSTGII